MIIPLLLMPPGAVGPSQRDREVWRRMHLDAASQFERMLGTRVDLDLALPAVMLTSQPIDSGEVNLSRAFWQVEAALAGLGCDVDSAVYSVCVIGTGGGGMGQPEPWRGWYQPSTGGLAVLGERHLRAAALAAKPGLTSPWTPMRRRAYFQNVLLLVHELCHAAGALPHYGGNPYDPAYARRTITNYGSYSGDAWYLGKLLPDGTYAGMLTNGLWSGPPSEHETCRASVHLNRAAGGEHLRIDPAERTDVLAGAIPAYQGLGHGRSAWEYVL